MIALDTNVLARLITRDDLKEAKTAAELIDAGDAFFVPLTVVLELEWVLRWVYKIEPNAMVQSFGALLSVRNLHFERQGLVLEALRLQAEGFDLPMRCITPPVRSAMCF